jgi:hypothetical protein
MSSRRAFSITLSLSLVLIGLIGCSISAKHDSQGGADKDVDIKTPLGSLSVHKGSTDPKETGLALYPGAQAKKDFEGEGSANVDISSPFLGVKVVALKYKSDDAPEKVLAFYRKEMAKYGKVLDCSGGFTMGYRRHDQDAPVTCEDGSGGGHEFTQELKVGTQNNQRIVAIKPSGSGSEFALVYVRAWDDKSTL